MLGAVFLAEVGEITRFTNSAQLACWAGLTPKHHESDTKVRRGRITKQGSRLVLWAAVESVKVAGSHHGGRRLHETGCRATREEHRHRRRRPQTDRVGVLRVEE